MLYRVWSASEWMDIKYMNLSFIFRRAESFACCAAYGAGSGQIWLDDLNCPAHSSSLDQCSGWSWGTHNCGHYEDASVVCSTDNDGEIIHVLSFTNRGYLL